ncbi:MAG: TonB-dependent receptor [Gallionella sp.]|nr:TonB-dependent receptor [Gallionella sp.]
MRHSVFRWSCVVLFSVDLAHAEDRPTLPEVKVTAPSEAVAQRRDAVTQKVVVSRKEIENFGVMTIGEVLGKLPGVELGSQNADGSSSQRVRGMSRDSVDILVDGERPAGGSRIVSGVVGRLPSGELERVEILRGTSAEFGGGASVTVNLIMKKAMSKRSRAVKAALGVNGTIPVSQFTWTESGGDKGFAWTLPVTLNLHRTPSLREMDRQDSVAGVRTSWQHDQDEGRYAFREFVLSPRLNWKSGQDTFSLSPLFFDGLGRRNNDSLLNAYTNPATGTGLAYNGMRMSDESNHRRLLRLRAEGEKRWGENKLSGRASLNRGRRSVDTVRDSYTALNVPSTATEHSLSNENETNLALRFDRPEQDHLLAAGAEYVQLRRQDEQQFGGSFVATAVHNASERQHIFWVQDDWTVQPKTIFTYGLRNESFQLVSDATAQQHSRWLPSVALRWEPAEQWVMRTSLGAGFKMPKLDEVSNSTVRSITANTPIEADQRGNPNLRPERNLNFEAVLERYLADESGMVAANMYVRDTHDFIERNVQLEGARWVNRPYNQGRARHWGWELDGKLRTDSLGWKGATIKAHLTLPHAQVDDVRLGLRRMARDTPRYVFSTGVEQSLPAWQSSYGVTLQLSGRSETDIPAEQRALTKAKVLLDAYWLYKLTPQFNLRISGQNLLAADTVRQNLQMAAGNEWQLNTSDRGNRSVLFTLEGHW